MKHHGKGKTHVVRRRYQRPKVQDLGTKWKLAYWDYGSGRARKRSKVWSKTVIPSFRQAQRRADEFMQSVNEINNNPQLGESRERTVADLHHRCQQLTWPHLKNSTVESYEGFFKTYILPSWGTTLLQDLRTMDLQAFFNSFHPRLSAKTIRLMHASFRAALSQAVAWNMLERNPAIGVKLPRKKTRKPPVLLTLLQVKQLIENLAEPTKSIVTLIVLGSMRVGEVLALHWKSVLHDRLLIEGRIYEGELDDVKTDAGLREVPFDRPGIMRAALERMRQKSKFLAPDDLVFSTGKGKPLNRRNLLPRHLKPAAKELAIPSQIDFRSFRTIHATLMRRTGARLEVVRDNMGHANVNVTADIYSKSWWQERVDAVSSASELITAAQKNEEELNAGGQNRDMLFPPPNSINELEPQLEPQG